MIRRLVVITSLTFAALVAAAAPARAATYLGCYLDDEQRALDTWLGDGHTVDSCVTAARNAGLAYAGLQWYGQCFGGNTLGYQQTPESECDTPCTNASWETCGGGWRNSIYAVGASTPATPTATTCTKDGWNQSCAGLTCGVTACYDASNNWMQCPADLIDACPAAAPTYCYKDGLFQQCAGLTCGVTSCYGASYNWMQCPADLVDACPPPAPTYCYKDGQYQWCSGLTCGVSACYGSSWNWMQCPAQLTTACAPSYEGFLDDASCGYVYGWVWTPSQPNTPQRIDIMDGQRVVATIDANLYRSDLVDAGKGDGRHGFYYPLTGLTGGHDLWVRVSGSNFSLWGSPRHVECAAPIAAEPLCGGGTASLDGQPAVSQLACDVGVVGNQLAIRFLGQWFALNYSGTEWTVVNNAAGVTSLGVAPRDRTQVVYSDSGLVQTRAEQLERAASGAAPTTQRQTRSWTAQIAGRSYDITAEQAVYDTSYPIASDALEAAGDLSFRVTMTEPGGVAWTVLVNPRRAQVTDLGGTLADQAAAESVESWGGEQIGSAGTLFTRRDVRYLPEVELASAVKTSASGGPELAGDANPALAGALDQLLPPGQTHVSYEYPGAIATSGTVSSRLYPSGGTTTFFDLNRQSQFYLDSRRSEGYSSPSTERPLLSIDPFNWKVRQTIVDQTVRWPFFAGLCGLEARLHSYVDGALRARRGCFDGQWVFGQVSGHLELGVDAGGGFGCGVPFLVSASAGLSGRILGRLDLESTVAASQVSANVSMYADVSYQAYFATRVLFWNKSWEKRIGAQRVFQRSAGFTVAADNPTATCPQYEGSCDDGADDDGDGLVDWGDSDCSTPPPQANAQTALNIERDRVMRYYAAPRGMAPCTLWNSWTVAQKEVFAISTDRLYQSKLTDGSTMLSHIDNLYAVRDRNGTSCGGGDANRIFMSMDETLAATVRGIAAKRTDGQMISDRLATQWKASCDPNAHAPFSNGYNEGSIDTHIGGSITAPCLVGVDKFPSGQLHFFPTKEKAVVVNRPGVAGIDDSNIVEMDHDFNVPHDSATQCSSFGPSVGRLPCGFLPSQWCSKNIDQYRSALNPDVTAYKPACY